METSSNNSEKNKLNFKDSKYSTGKRKTSIAKVWLKKGNGKIYVNGKNFETYFKRASHKMQIVRPFEIINQSTEYDVRSTVVGGGLSGLVAARKLIDTEYDVLLIEYDSFLGGILKNSNKVKNFLKGTAMNL